MRKTFVPHTATDGTRLHVVRWEPAESEKVRAVMHIAHGMAEHCGRYERLAEALTKAGFVVFANDHRGHGKTAQPSAEDNASALGHLGDEGGWGAALGDLRALIRKEQAEYPGLPFVLFGHSMGSFMVQELLFDLSDVLAAAVLSGSNGKPTPIAAAGRLVARAEKLRLGARGHSKLLTALSFDTEVDAYVADSHCGFPCSTATWIEVLDALGRIALPDLQRRIRKDLPIYIFSGARDAANGNTSGLVQLLGAYQRVGLREVSHRFYEGARHEVLNETNRDEVTRDLLSFLDQKVLCDARSTS